MKDIRRKYNLMVKFSKFTFSVSLDGIENNPHLNLVFFFASHALFMGPANTKKHKFCFKTGSHDTIHIFKNYFAIVFSLISFQFSTINGI